MAADRQDSLLADLALKLTGQTEIVARRLSATYSLDPLLLGRLCGRRSGTAART